MENEQQRTPMEEAEQQQQTELVTAIDRFLQRPPKKVSLEEQQRPGRYVVALPPEHDNGVVDAPIRKIKNKKMDAIMQELAEERSARIEISKQLEKANETIRALQASLATLRSESVSSVEFS